MGKLLVDAVVDGGLLEERDEDGQERGGAGGCGCEGVRRLMAIDLPIV